uniref:Reverse transcriptase domain-containing protein n=1 Tax=Tanacetum cinerariifolium TaxID=118510 RepID=A0A699HNM0_TANCI|nr:reverse transcriptase domain-containing protein [Tanacetum cinerariifolium]
MSTRSSARNLFPPLDNLELTIRRRSLVDPILLNDFEMATEGNGDPPVPDLRNMEELYQPNLNGRGGPIARDDANKHLDKFLYVTQTIKVNGVTDDALRVYLFPHSLTHHATAWFDRLPKKSINTINQMAKMFLGKYFPPSMDTSAQPSESSSSITSSSDLEIISLKAKMAEINKNLMKVLQINQQVKEVTPNYETCGGPHSYNDCPATVGQTQNVYAAGAYQCGNSYQPQGVSHGQTPPPAYQALSYQALVYQPSISKSQVVTTTEFTNYMKANDAILKNMQTNMTSLTNSNLELKNMFGQFMKINTASSSCSGTLLSNTVTNPKEDLKDITTRSGTAYQGPTIPTTSSSSPKVVEREIEVIKDTVPPTNNGSTKDVQTLVFQIKTPILNSEPVVAPIAEPVFAPVSAPKPNQKSSISYPSRLHDQKLRDKANDQKEKFFQIFKDLNFNISFTDTLILMPKFGPTIKSLLTNKDKLYELARTLLNKHYSMVLLKKLPEKLRDPGKFLILCDFLRMDECLALADLGASINLMPLSVWNKLSLPELTPTFMTLELADRRSFLKTERALIDVYNRELTLRVNNEAVTLNLDQTLRYSANYNDMTMIQLHGNKVDLDEQSLDDLFNNLKIYEAEVKGSSTSNQNTQNIAFMSSINTDSINESVNVVPTISAASSKSTVSTLPNVDSLSDVVIYFFFSKEAILPGNADHQGTTGIKTLLEELFQWRYLLQMLWCLSVMQLVAMIEVFRLKKNILIMHLWHMPPQAHQVLQDQIMSHESDNNVPKNPENDRYKTGEGYHAVTPPYTRTFIPHKPDLVFNDAPNASGSVANVVNVESSTNKPSKDMSKTLRTDAPIIKDWISDSKDETEIGLDHLIKDYDYYEKQMVQKPMWNNAMRVSHQNSVRMTHPYSNRNFVTTAVLTRSRLVSLNAARLVSTVVTQSTMKSPRLVEHVVNKEHSPIRRPINHRLVTKNSNFNIKVTTVKVNKVNVVQGTKGNAAKASANWVWKPKCQVLDHVSRLTSVSITLKKFNYTDALGRSNSFSWYQFDEKDGIRVTAGDLKATTTMKKVNDVVQLRVLIDGKNVIVSEDVIRRDLRLDDADGVECLPNDDIFVELARMGYEKPPLKLTFYKAYFSTQWKFLIHTLVQCLSAKRTAWNEFSCSMASTGLGKVFLGVETPLFASMLVQPQPQA